MGKLYLPPIKLESMERDPAAPAVGVPVVPFPRWMRCSLCDTLSSVESGVFKLVHLSKDDFKFIAKTEESFDAKVGAKANFSFDAKRAFVYDMNKKAVSTVSPSSAGGH